MEDLRMTGINGINNNTNKGSITSQETRSRPDPGEKFKELDTDGSNGLDKTELSALAKELSQMMGKSLDVDASISTYDADGDGELSQKEMNSMMKDTLGQPPEAPPGGAGQPMPNISFADSDKDQLAALLKMLEQQTDSAASLNVPPDPAATFKELDTDGSGGLNKTELDNIASDFGKMTGRTFDAAKALSSYDADQDGELNQDEIDTMMQNLREDSAGPPPARPENLGGTSRKQVSDSYLANSGEDRLSQFRRLMDRLASDLATGPDKETSSS